MKVHFILLAALALGALSSCAVREEEEVMLQEGDIDRTTGKSPKMRSRLMIGRGANGESVGVGAECMKNYIEGTGDVDMETGQGMTTAIGAAARGECNGKDASVRQAAAPRGVSVRSINWAVAFHPGRLYYGQSTYNGLGCGFWSLNWSINCVYYLGGWSPQSYWSNGSYYNSCYNTYNSTNWWGSLVNWWYKDYFNDSCWYRWY